jgi:ankyrin repeat protein
MELNKILFDCLKNNKFAEFIDLLNQDKTIDTNVRDENDNYLIIYAILKNKLDIVKLLIERGSRIDIVDQEGKSILYQPIKYGYNDIIKILLEYDKVNIGMSLIDTRDRHSNIPLHYAIFFKNIVAINLLLDYGSNPNIIDANGNNALHLSIYTRDIEICKVIINKDVNINARTSIGESALHIACNFQLEPIVHLLINNGIDVNIQDYDNEITALSYAINLNNKNISIFLMDHRANQNIQDFIGNTAIHYTIIEEIHELTAYLLTSKKLSLTTNVNIYNIVGKMPLHLFLEKEIIPQEEFIKFLLLASNLNFQDISGNTPLHLICQKNLWLLYKDILIKKKLNIFATNEEGKKPIDYISEKDLSEFIDIVTQSYLYVLRNYNFTWKESWENVCRKELYFDKLSDEEHKIISQYIDQNDKQNKDICYDIIKKKLMVLIKNKTFSCDNLSYPQKVNKKCISFDKTLSNTEYCNFTGITLDILMGLIYLLQKYSYACSTVPNNFIINNDLCNYYKNIGIQTTIKCEFLNFEIVWIYKKLFFSDNFVNNFKKCLSKTNIRFIIIPLGIEIKEGSHANYLLFDKQNYELERFEPYGSHSPYKFNYNAGLLDNVLSFKFNDIDPSIKYISPAQFLPKIGFQYFESYESKTKKIGDPGGFCAIWSIWYTEMRLIYPDIPRKSLVNKLMKKIKSENYSFKNIIRNYSPNITKLRDMVFKKAGIDINIWVNDRFTEEQYKIMIQEITNLLNQITNI